MSENDYIDKYIETYPSFDSKMLFATHKYVQIFLTRSVSSQTPQKPYISLSIVVITKAIVQFLHCLAKMLKIRSERNVNNNTVVGFHKVKPIFQGI